MEIKSINELSSYVNRVTCRDWDDTYPKRNDGTNHLINRITDYIKQVSEFLKIDYDELYNSLKSNLTYYYSDPVRTKSAMHSVSKFTHIIDDSKFLYGVQADWNEYDGSLSRLVIEKIHLILNIDQLFELPWSDDRTLDTMLKPRKLYNIKSGKFKTNSKPENAIVCYSEADGDTMIFCSHYDTCNDGIIADGLHLFTTESEAKEYYDFCKNKPIVKSKKCIDEENRIERTYGDILRMAKQLSKDQVGELEGLITKLFNQKVADSKLNPLQLALEYKDRATRIDSFLPSEGDVIRDWVDEHMDPSRYETIEYSSILDRVLESYPSSVKWVNIKKVDKEIIIALSQALSSDCAGFKYDW